MQRWRRASQLISELGSQLQQTRSVKACTTKLPVVLSKVTEHERLGRNVPSLDAMLDKVHAQQLITKLTGALLCMLQDVEGLGPAGKPTRVSHGYARNYLLPKRLVQVGHQIAAQAAGTTASRAAAASPAEVCMSTGHGWTPLCTQCC